MCGLRLKQRLKAIPEVEQGCPSIISGQALTPRRLAATGSIFPIDPK